MTEGRDWNSPNRGTSERGGYGRRGRVLRGAEMKVKGDKPTGKSPLDSGGVPQAPTDVQYIGTSVGDGKGPTQT